MLGEQDQAEERLGDEQRLGQKDAGANALRVFPETPAAWTNEAEAARWEKVERVTRAVNAVLTPDGIMVSQFNGAPAGQTIFHLHFHIIPRWQGVELSRHAAAMGDMAELKVLAGEIGARVV